VDHGFHTLVRFLKAAIEGNHSGDHRREARQGGAGRRAQPEHSKNHRYELYYANFIAETALNAEIDRAGAENVLALVAPPAPAAVSTTTSTRALPTDCMRMASSPRLRKSTQRNEIGNVSSDLVRGIGPAV